VPDAAEHMPDTVTNYFLRGSQQKILIYSFEDVLIDILFLYTGETYMISQTAGTVVSTLSGTRVAGELVRVNVLVPARVRKEWKAVALASDKTLTDFIIEAMQHQINRTKRTETPTI